MLDCGFMQVLVDISIVCAVISQFTSRKMRLPKINEGATKPVVFPQALSEVKSVLGSRNLLETSFIANSSA